MEKRNNGKYTSLCLVNRLGVKIIKTRDLDPRKKIFDIQDLVLGV